MSPAYKSTPDEIKGMPSGIPYIVGNEAAERFSFYGMKAILMTFLSVHVFMTMDYEDTGEKFNKDQAEALATQWIHWFNVAVYILPFIGATLSDWLFGKYKTILVLSFVYCLGHLTLAIDESVWGMGFGLALIALGAGGIKPCVSAHVGDQFGKANQDLLPRVFSWFYFSINVGAFASSLLIPLVLAATVEEYGGAIAFGIPGILMFIATLMFWMGRNKFIHVPPRRERFFHDNLNPEALSAISALLPIYLLISVFWSCFDQTASRWVAQAGNMNGMLGEIKILPSQMQSLNPILVLIYIPLFTYLVYPLIDKVFRLTPLRKMGIGFFVTAAAFSCSAGIQTNLDAGIETHILWQIIPYMLLTAGEILVSITALEFSYTQAPKSAKSIVMAFFLGSVALGNVITAITNSVITNDDGSSILPGAQYYWFFAALVFLAGILFIGAAKIYWGRCFLDTTDLAA